ncbi:MAG: hypothetical protein ABSH24_35580 [Bryobacteraceae bacterium]
MVHKMVVRVRFPKGPKVRRTRRKNKQLAMAFASFLTPASVMAAALGLWRLAEDPHWAGDFAIRQGLFSHWQVWFAFAALLQTGAYLLNRYGRSGGRGLRA